MSYLFTSESVSEGHPDKVSDQISDGILDNFLAFDPNSKVACETLVTTGQVVLSGEVSSSTYIDVQNVAREIIKKSGMPVWREDFTSDNGNIILDINHMSITEPIKLEKELNQIPGVLTVGLFAERPADKVLVSSETEVVELKIK